MTRIARTLIAVVLVSSFVVPAEASTTKEAIAFTVTNPATPGISNTVRGHITRPAGCTTTVVLALHGLSYGEYAWDFPLDPQTYSTADAMAARGYAFVAIDRLGYGASDRPNGYTLTVESYADMTRQIVDQLRSAGFGNVVLLGHSAGSEITELTAGLHGGVDAIIATGYQHAIDGLSSEWLVREWITGDVVRSFQSDYEEFEQGYRDEDMYNLDVADPDVVALDNELANLTPSGEIFTISEQPSRSVLDRITVPVLLVLAEKDVLFPVANAANELALFSGSTDKTLHVVKDAGHVMSLHPNAPATNAVIGDWLGARLPVC